jgi:hypothetical protein
MSDTSMSLLSCRSHLKLTSLKFCYFPMRTSNCNLHPLKLQQLHALFSILIATRQKSV